MEQKAHTSDTPTTAAKPNACLDRLPPEVTEKIAECLQCEHRGWGLDDFRNLRLTSKDLYFKTFRLFGAYYFTKVSVAFTVVSLRRLRDLANHTKKFGLALSIFPKSLRCSTYRLPAGAAVKTLLLPARDIARSAELDAVAEAIDLTYKSEQATIVGPNDSRIEAIARKYRKAVVEQCSIENSGYDVRSLSESMAALPNLQAVTCTVNGESWGQTDWTMIAGISKISFLNMEYLLSEKSNLTIAATKVLCAIAKANELCRWQGRSFHFDHLELCGHPRKKEDDDDDEEKEKREKTKKALLEEGPDPDAEYITCSQSVAFYQIDISNHQEPLRDALSDLKSLSLSASPCEQEWDTAGRNQTILTTFLTSPEIERFSLELIDASTMDPTISYVTADYLFDMALETQRFTRLRTLDLNGLDIYLRMQDIMLIVQANSATLEKLHVGCLGHTWNQLHDVTASRDAWRPFLRMAARCQELRHFTLTIYSGWDEMDIDIDQEGQEAVSDLLAKLIVSPTEPGRELGWII